MGLKLEMNMKLMVNQVQRGFTSWICGVLLVKCWLRQEMIIQLHLSNKDIKIHRFCVRVCVRQQALKPRTEL